MSLLTMELGPTRQKEVVPGGHFLSLGVLADHVGEWMRGLAQCFFQEGGWRVALGVHG